MKKNLILVAIAVVFVSACKKSENKPSASSIVGRWTHTKDIVQNYTAAGQYNLTDTADFSKSNDYYQFNSDGTGLVYQETAIGSGQYTSISFTYNLSGTTLTMTVNGSSETENVKTLTASSLVIHAEYVTKDSNGNILYTDKADEYFSK